MKQFKKMLPAVLTVIMLFSFTACAANRDDSNTPGINGQITIMIADQGFGTKWLYDMGDVFFAKTGIKVKISKSYLVNEIEQLVQTGNLPQDIAMSAQNMFISQDTARLVDISSVYNTVPEGETLSIKQQMNPDLVNRLTAADGNFYVMPTMESLCSLVYNKTTLDEAFGEDNYTIPRTTKELIAFSEQVKGKGLYAYSLSTSVPYLDYVHLVWWAQYDGYDAYRDYYSGYYYDANGDRKVAQNGEVLESPGRYKSLDVTTELYKKANKYVHQYADSMNFQDAQIAFLGQGYKGRDMTKCAFMANGSWLENEMMTYLSVKPQEICMMRLPVLSEITEKLEDRFMTDAALASLVTAIDEGATSYEGVSANDFERVRQARRMVFTGSLDSTAAIPTTSKNQEKAKQFLTFMASEEGQKIYSNALYGLTMPYGYAPELSSVSNYVRSRFESFGKDYVPIYNDVASPLVYRKGFSAYGSGLEGRVYSGATSTMIINSAKNDFMSRWDDIISAIT